MSIARLEAQLLSISSDETHRTVARLKDNVTITLENPLAQKLLNGTWKYRRMGLAQFDKAVRLVWFGAKEDDPYADWFLLKTYDAYLNTRKYFKNFEEQCFHAMHSIQGLEIKVCSNATPQKHSLLLKSPFGYMGAILITDLDHALCYAITLKRLGLANLLDKINIYKLIDIVQVAFEVPRGWKNLNLTRQDLINNTPKAIDAQVRWGFCPSAVVERKLQFSYWPAIIEKDPAIENVLSS